MRGWGILKRHWLYAKLPGRDSGDFLFVKSGGVEWVIVAERQSSTIYDREPHCRYSGNIPLGQKGGVNFTRRCSAHRVQTWHETFRKCYGLHCHIIVARPGRLPQRIVDAMDRRAGAHSMWNWNTFINEFRFSELMQDANHLILAWFLDWWLGTGGTGNRQLFGADQGDMEQCIILWTTKSLVWCSTNLKYSLVFGIG